MGLLPWRFWLLLLLCSAPPVWGRSFPHTPDLLLDTQERWGASMQGYVIEGCLPPASPTTQLTMAPCRAFVRSGGDPPRLVGLSEAGARTLTLPAVDGRYWLVARLGPAATPAGWTCLPGTHYCWLGSATEPPLPPDTVWLAVATVTGGAAATVEPLHAVSPLDLRPLTVAEYATQHGMVCDGVSDNSAALEKAYQALPASGGVLILPASPAGCRFSRTFTITKPVHLLGPGRQVGGGGGTAMVQLQYTGTGVGISIGEQAAGTILEGFNLQNVGTGTVGVLVEETNTVLLRDFSLAFGTPWTSYGIDLCPTAACHTMLLERVAVREAAPIGLRIGRVQAVTRIWNSKFSQNTETQIQVGHLVTALYTHIIGTDITPAVTNGVGVKVLRAQGVWLDHCYVEVANTVVGISVPATAAQAEQIVVSNSRFGMNGTVDPVAVVLNFIGAEFTARDNIFSLGGAAPPGVVIVQNDAARSVLLANNSGAQSFVWTTNYRDTILRDTHGTPPGFVDDFAPVLRCSRGPVGGNQGGGEDPMEGCTIQANRLWRQDVSGMRITMGGNTAANNNTKQVRLYIGGQLLFASGAAAVNNQDWDVNCTGVRSDTGTGIFFACNGHWNGSPVPTQVTPGLSLNFAAPLVVQPTAEGVNDGDIVQRLLVVEIWP